MNDEHFMRRALRLAARAKGNTSPNPMVGAVVVRDGAEVGSGFHERAGAAHAETVALRAAGPAANGATLYVTLEPCAHLGRTPPCTDAIIASGIKRVVIAVEDPDERVRGRGIAQLRAAQLDVHTGVRAGEARELNKAYFFQRQTGRPFVTLKMAQSLNGFVAERPGVRQQLTGDEAAKHVRLLRFEHDAVMIGVNTVVIDDPQLTVRPRKRRHVPYLRIVVDSKGRIPLESRILREQSKAKTIVATTAAMPAAVIAQLEKKHIEVMQCAGDAEQRVDVSDLIQRLGRKGMLSLLCEGGPTLAAALLNAQCVQQLHWIVTAHIIGSAEAVPVLAKTSARRARIRTASILGADTLIIASPEY